MLDGVKDFAADKLCNAGYEEYCPKIAEATSWLPGYGTIIAGVAAVGALVGGAYVAKNQLGKKEGPADAPIAPVAADNASEDLGRYKDENGRTRSRRLAGD